MDSQTKQNSESKNAEIIFWGDAKSTQVFIMEMRLKLDF